MYLVGQEYKNKYIQTNIYIKAFSKKDVLLKLQLGIVKCTSPPSTM